MPCRVHSLAVAAIFLTAGVQTPALAQPGDIKGQDVKGDANKSANDGWSQAPVPREQSAAKDAPDPGGASTKQNGSRPVPDAGSSDNSGKGPASPSK